ncbi:Resolvase, N terminal domain [Nitrosovibrio tenuis]|uniref:Resolvase, N terminal domain n=1 Tax=Nitrosovibrio tenuis TaxID=1233 RepID=A0A1H7IDJ3_9PROT|nr:Resolvase, N terminal domain [Nitrosovibrio tenuis]
MVTANFAFPLTFVLNGAHQGLKSLQNPIDTHSPSGKLVFRIFAALTEFERGVIREQGARKQSLCLPQRRLIHQGDLFPQFKYPILPIVLCVEPRECLFEGGVVPALRQPRGVMNQTQGA